MQKILKKFNNSGTSLLEVVVAILIITIGMVGVLSVVIQNIQAEYVNKNVLIASGLAQEGLELVRNVRDYNWLTPGNAWDQNLSAGTMTIDYRGWPSIVHGITLGQAGSRLYVNNTNGFYTHDPLGNTLTNFYRLVTISSNPTYLDVVSTIRWTEGSENHDYSAETYLYNWR